MIGRLLRWSTAALLAALLLVVVAAAWLIATQSGARWLLAQAANRFPEPLSIERVSGTLWRGFELQNIGWQDDSATITIADVSTDVELLPLLGREIRVNTLFVRSVDIAMHESAETESDAAPLLVDIPVTLALADVAIEDVSIATTSDEMTIDTIRLAGGFSGSALKIQRFELRSPQADIGLSGTARLVGPYPIYGNVAWRLRLQDQPSLSGKLQVSGDAAGYEIQHTLDAPYAISSNGSIGFDQGDAVVDLQNRWNSVRLERSESPVIELVNGELSVAGKITGNISSLNFDGDTTLVSEAVPATTLRAEGTFTGDRVDFTSLAVANDWGQLLANGEVLLPAGPSWRFDMQLSELNPAFIDARLQGALELLGETSGQLIDGQPNLNLTLERLSGELNDYSVAGSGSLKFAKGRLNFDEMLVSVGDNRLKFAGNYGPGLTIDANARFADLDQLALGIGGTLNSDFSLESDLQTVAASGFVRGENLSWDGQVIERLNADFQIPTTGDGAVSLQLESSEHGSVVADLSGRFADSQWLGAIDALTVRRDWLGEWTLDEAAGLTVSGTELQLETACLGTTETDGLACIALNYGFAGPLNFETTISALPLASLPRYLPEGASLLGVIGLQASGEFADGRLDANAKLGVEGLGLLASFDGDDVSANFEQASITADIIDNRFVGKFDIRLQDSEDHISGSVNIEDILDTRSALSGQGSLSLNDLGLLSFFYPDVANAKGAIYGRVETTGSLAAPEISGEIRLRDGSADIRLAGISVADVGISVAQSKAGELAVQGSARSGDGYLQINGTTSFGTETGVRSEVRLSGENFQLLRLPDWQAAASPDITVLFDERETRVSGELAIPEASITVKNLPETVEKPSPDVVVHRGDSATVQPRRMLYVDVTTALGEDVSFSGFGLSTGLEGSVRITGSSRSPYQGQGRVVLNEGRYQAYGQNLEIESGELIFNGPLGNPTLNVRASRTASDKTVAGIHLTGTPAQLTSRVYSEPALGDAEALSYLLTGRPLASANAEQGDMLNQAAFALGLTTAGSVASRIRNQLGLETLGIQGGSENRQLVAGKRFGDRLFIEYAYGVVDSLGTLLLRYQLSRRLMVESRSGSVRNLDVVYSVKKP